MTWQSVIETRELTKRYGGSDAVHGLNLKVSAGSITGFLGRNGAGKSSTIKMLLGITRPTSGTGFLLGRPIGSARELSDARCSIAASRSVFRRSLHDWIFRRTTLNRSITTDGKLR